MPPLPRGRSITISTTITTTPGGNWPPTSAQSENASTPVVVTNSLADEALRFTNTRRARSLSSPPTLTAEDLLALRRRRCRNIATRLVLSGMSLTDAETERVDLMRAEGNKDIWNSHLADRHVAAKVSTLPKSDGYMDFVLGNFDCTYGLTHTILKHETHFNTRGISNDLMLTFIQNILSTRPVFTDKEQRLYDAGYSTQMGTTKKDRYYAVVIGNRTHPDKIITIFPVTPKKRKKTLTDADFAELEEESDGSDSPMVEDKAVQVDIEELEGDLSDAGDVDAASVAMDREGGNIEEEGTADAEEGVNAEEEGVSDDEEGVAWVEFDVNVSKEEGTVSLFEVMAGVTFVAAMLLSHKAVN
ncbi:hypothetical protein BJ508DRAFT_332590 [Ascobolus immersus RN42]|uniref:Uncharacterized protein n=1 Tax=Ascobolus immersus RN42 TaxID=1160509 RepID=A0A3N4HT04_ASCIM|nr:hypothetical protein BJ508DRAFT_332590 [Ascobolus immersus RN42]